MLAYLNTKVWSDVAKSSAVAPPAYGPAQAAYYEALSATGQGFVAATVKADLAMTSAVGNRFTTTWASQAADLTTADYLPILAGKKPVTDLPAYVDKINALIKANG